MIRYFLKDFKKKVKSAESSVDMYCTSTVLYIRFFYSLECFELVCSFGLAECIRKILVCTMINDRW